MNYYTCYDRAIWRNIQLLGLCIVPPSSWVNTDIPISQYCPPAHATRYTVITNNILFYMWY